MVGHPNILETTPWNTKWGQINHLRKHGTIVKEQYMALKYVFFSTEALK